MSSEKVKKAIKGILAMGLGVMVSSMSAFAMNNNKQISILQNELEIMVKEEIKEEVKKVKKEIKREMKLSDQQAMLRADVYMQGLIIGGESKDYADYYTMLVIERGLSEYQAMMQADVYIQGLVLTGGDKECADYYAELVI